MAIKGKNADLIKRFKFYAFGFAIGMLLVSMLYKGKGCQLPNSAKMEELTWQKLEYTEQAECIMKCRSISQGELKQVLKSGKINYDKSDVRKKPYGTYAIEGPTATGKNLRIIIADCDTISRVDNAIDLKMETDNCNCK